MQHVNSAVHLSPPGKGSTFLCHSEPERSAPPAVVSEASVERGAREGLGGPLLHPSPIAWEATTPAGRRLPAPPPGLLCLPPAASQHRPLNGAAPSPAGGGTLHITPRAALVLALHSPPLLPWAVGAFSACLARVIPQPPLLPLWQPLPTAPLPPMASQAHPRCPTLTHSATPPGPLMEVSE